MDLWYIQNQEVADEGKSLQLLSRGSLVFPTQVMADCTANIFSALQTIEPVCLQHSSVPVRHAAKYALEKFSLLQLTRQHSTEATFSHSCQHLL